MTSRVLVQATPGLVWPSIAAFVEIALHGKYYLCERSMIYKSREPDAEGQRLKGRRRLFAF